MSNKQNKTNAIKKKYVDDFLEDQNSKNLQLLNRTDLKRYKFETLLKRLKNWRKVFINYSNSLDQISTIPKNRKKKKGKGSIHKNNDLVMRGHGIIDNRIVSLGCSTLIWYFLRKNKNYANLYFKYSESNRINKNSSDALESFGLSKWVNPFTLGDKVPDAKSNQYKESPFFTAKIYHPGIKIFSAKEKKNLKKEDIANKNIVISDSCTTFPNNINSFLLLINNALETKPPLEAKENTLDFEIKKIANDPLLVDDLIFSIVIFYGKEIYGLTDKECWRSYYEVYTSSDLQDQKSRQLYSKTPNALKDKYVEFMFLFAYLSKNAPSSFFKF